MSLELTDSHPVNRAEEILTGDALAFVESLHRRFAARRDELLAARTNRREQVARAGTMNFLAETADVRTNEWTVAPAPRSIRWSGRLRSRPGSSSCRPAPPARADSCAPLATHPGGPRSGGAATRQKPAHHR